MPYVHLLEDGVSFWYRSNLSGDGSVCHLDRSRPTILLLHGAILDSSGFVEQFSDPRLADRFNLIAIDSRSTGLTLNTPHPRRDSWTDVAELMKVIDKLDLPPLHIFACCFLSIHVAVRLTILRPEEVLSLTLVSVERERDEESKWVDNVMMELVQMFMTAKDLEALEETIHEFLPYNFNDSLSEEKKDFVAHYIEIQYNPARCTRFMDFSWTSYSRLPLTSEELGLIESPILIINGENIASSPEAAWGLSRRLVNATGGAKVHIIPRGPQELYFVPPFSQAVNTAFVHFLEGLQTPSSSRRGTKGDLRTALATLAKVKGDLSIAERDANLSISFSCVSPEAEAQCRAMLEHAAEIEKTGFCPTKHGELLRKFSERYSEEASHRERQSYLETLGLVTYSEVSVEEVQ